MRLIVVSLVGLVAALPCSASAAVLLGATVGCKAQADALKAATFKARKDAAALAAFTGPLTASGACASFAKGVAIDVDEKRLPLSCVRLTGDLSCYWVPDAMVDLHPAEKSGTGGRGGGGRRRGSATDPIRPPAALTEMSIAPAGVSASKPLYG